jgi:transcription elongation factor Elf1
MLALRLWSYGVCYHHFSGTVCLIFWGLFCYMEALVFCPMLVPNCLSTKHIKKNHGSLYIYHYEKLKSLILTQFFLLTDNGVMIMEDSQRQELPSDRKPLWFSDDNTSSFHCIRCGKQYLRKRTLLRHMRYDCGTEPRFSCSMCGLRTRRRYTLTSHLVAVHGVHRQEAEYNVPLHSSRDRPSVPY